jgi:integrase
VSGVYKYATKAGDRWRIVYDGPPEFDPATGEARRKQRQRRGFLRERDAKKALRDALTSVDEQRHVDVRTDTLGGFLQSWLDGLVVRATTVASYEQQVRLRIVPHLGGVRLQELNTEHLNALYRHLERAGSVKGESLAPKSVRKVHEVLSRALGDAVKRGYLVRNVAEHASPPPVRRREMRVWTPEELRAFLSSVSGDRLYALWLLYATTGLRRGEALALHWDDIDLDRGTIYVHRNRTLAKGKVVVHETKTEHGRRKIALDPTTISAFHQHRLRQVEERLAADVAWHDSASVFVRSDGRGLHPSNDVSKRFSEHAALADLRPIRLHDLRHTYATIALSNGVPITVVSRRLGHATVSVTLDIYSHCLPTDDSAAAAKVAGLILGA